MKPSSTIAWSTETVPVQTTAAAPTAKRESEADKSGEHATPSRNGSTTVIALIQVFPVFSTLNVKFIVSPASTIVWSRPRATVRVDNVFVMDMPGAWGSGTVECDEDVTGSASAAGGIALTTTVLVDSPESMSACQRACGWDWKLINCFVGSGTRDCIVEVGLLLPSQDCKHCAWSFQSIPK